MRIIENKIYEIDKHPNKEKCYEWIRNNWHDLNDHSVNEVIDSIAKLSYVIGGTFDFCVGQTPDRNEHITFKDYDYEELSQLNSENCSLTGTCWDNILIEGLKEGKPTKVLDALHKDTEYKYSDEGLFELCVANEYEFYENGELYDKK